jgi:glycine oxidase
MDISGGDVVIVGGGLVGLAVAFELARRGATVRVFDTGEPGRAASWAGAGMLAPYTEAVDDPEFLDLCAASLAAYPEFVERVREGSGFDPKLRLDGIVNAAFDEKRFEHVSGRARDLRNAGIACDLLDRAETLAMEPALGANVVGAAVVRCEGSVDNRRLGRALLAACVARGVLVSQVAFVGLECDERRALGVRTDRGFVPASAIVNACGAWAGSLDGVPAAFLPPVFPVKGQMLALAIPDGLVRRPVWVPGAYFVPREGGRLLVGATVESEGFDTRATAGGVHALLDAALAAAPALRGFSVAETWAGLRPGSPDGRPFIGATPLEGFYLATGHFRNGILLAPATATLVADAIAGERAATEAFGLGRLISRV